jgi:hypothetical protein
MGASASGREKKVLLRAFMLAVLERIEAELDAAVGKYRKAMGVNFSLGWTMDQIYEELEQDEDEDEDDEDCEGEYDEEDDEECDEDDEEY